MNAPERVDTGACSNAERTSGAIATGPGSRLTGSSGSRSALTTLGRAVDERLHRDDHRLERRFAAAEQRTERLEAHVTVEDAARASSPR
jgi:hypothetical protein